MQSSESSFYLMQSLDPTDYSGTEPKSTHNSCQNSPNLTQSNPTHGWTQPVPVSVSSRKSL